jgi:hypothetical protein
MTNLVAVLQRVLSEYVDLLNALPVKDDTLLKIAEACACREQLAALPDEPRALPAGFFRCGFCHADAPEGRHVCGDEYSRAVVNRSEKP